MDEKRPCFNVSYCTRTGDTWQAPTGDGAGGLAHLDCSDIDEVWDRLTVLPDGVDLKCFQSPCESRRSDAIIFSGKMSYHANTTAAIDLVQSVNPQVYRY